VRFAFSLSTNSNVPVQFQHRDIRSRADAQRSRLLIGDTTRAALAGAVAMTGFVMCGVP
jgi:hypothetical protein